MNVLKRLEEVRDMRLRRERGSNLVDKSKVGDQSLEQWKETK